MHRIKCAHCRRNHRTSTEVWQCSIQNQNARRSFRAAMAMQTPPTPTPPRGSRVPNEFLETVPDGYYAVRPDTVTPYTFMRVSRPKKGRLAGAIKVQTMHSDDLETAYILWPSGRTSIMRHTIEDKLLLLVVDPKGAAVAFGRELRYCCRCRKALTDPRSRHYGIGPECEKHWPEIIDMVNEAEGEYRGLG